MEQMRMINGQAIQTYRGVYLDINNSDICSLQNGVYFYFCSQLMKEKFEKNLDLYIKSKIERLQKIFPNTKIEALELVLSIEYYKYIEKRGFRIETLHGARIKQGYILGDIEFEEKQEE